MQKSFIEELKEWSVSIVIAAVVAFSIKTFLFDIIEVSGTSMLPTLHDKDRVAIEKITLYTKDIKRGEIVILDPGTKGRGIYIKRVIGLPGETIEIKNGNVYINGEILHENYLRSGTYTDIDMKVTIPEDSVFVMGDNRQVSEDSRIIGPIPIKNLKGHALFRIFPFNQMGKI
ncbi:signal peptidase I [Fonticella tunisiensis]|uniref:Signal peptidase I n=1 Tax=Fonticella tunisiensis TaxID=1096341 RepID=A0A4R7KAU7_9CLOT|nr:signal peptidase I [Fonticella tunisiensis]TDT51239.1 signal peptidase I [Fonticella tunisiensis]